MRIVVVDDNDVWRPSLVAALTSRGMSVAAETSDGEQLLALLPTIGAEPIEVAVLDLRLPPTFSDEGIHLARELRRRYGDLGVIILSGYEHDVQLHYATQALSNLGGRGGMAYLFKDRTSRSSLKEAVERVAAGRIVVDPHLTKIFRQLLPAGADSEVQGDSRRENRRVLTVLEWLRRTGRLT